MNALRKYRERNYLTQRELADRLSVSRLMVQRWETGKTKIDGDALKRVCRLTGLGMIELRPDLDFGRE